MIIIILSLSYSDDHYYYSNSHYDDNDNQVIYPTIIKRGWPAGQISYKSTVDFPAHHV